MSKAPRRRRTKQCGDYKGPPPPVRIGDLFKLYRDRYGGGPFPDDDTGREDLRIVLDHYSVSNPLRMDRIVGAWAPWLVGPERDALVEEKMRFPRFWKTQELGNVLNLTEADRVRLKINTIGTIDVTPTERKRKRKLRDRQWQRAKRLAQGATPREQSKSRLKPWEATGESRATYYRRLKAAASGPPDTNPSQHDSDTQVSAQAFRMAQR